MRTKMIKFSVRVHLIFKNALFNFSFNFHRADASALDGHLAAVLPSGAAILGASQAAETSGGSLSSL